MITAPAKRLCGRGRALLTAAIELTDPERRAEDGYGGARRFLAHCERCVWCSRAGLNYDSLRRALAEDET